MRNTRCVRWPPARVAPKSIGHSKWPTYWTHDTPVANGLTLVCDNLNTHTKGAFYMAFPPEQARAYVKRIHFCHTPKHGSWQLAVE